MLSSARKNVVVVVVVSEENRTSRQPLKAIVTCFSKYLAITFLASLSKEKGGKREIKGKKEIFCSTVHCVVYSFFLLLLLLLPLLLLRRAIHLDAGDCQIVTGVTKLYSSLRYE